ncbi:Borealin-like, N-terminal [Phaffia rhodozyma]|uniref:Borealin-like, N-terminal n=1 Tax=Phaffia rhodozyma TaxID=264483 RepID=A0A0F7SRQ8_PHARH|nr:Borealin-like, N-terminal [Phaffia rhodozyma]
MGTPRVTERQVKMRMSLEEKEAILENFDLEVAHRLENFKMLHQTLLDSFLTRQETEIHRIPIEIRRLTVKELGERWSTGGMKDVVEGLARYRLKKVQEAGRLGEERELEAREEGGKRKRTTTTSSQSTTDGRRIKQPRVNPSSNKSPMKFIRKPTKTSKSHTKTTQSTSTNHPSTSSSAVIPPSCPTFQFHPLLPATPLIARTSGSYRKPRKDETIVMSLNGSPVLLDELLKRMRDEKFGSASDQDDDVGGDNCEEEDDAQEEGEAVGLGLLDEEDLLRKLEDQQNTSYNATPSSSSEIMAKKRTKA